MRDRLHSNIMRAAAFGTARVIERGAKAVGWTPVSLDPDRLEARFRFYSVCFQPAPGKRADVNLTLP